MCATTKLADLSSLVAPSSSISCSSRSASVRLGSGDVGTERLARVLPPLERFVDVGDDAVRVVTESADRELDDLARRGIEARGLDIDPNAHMEAATDFPTGSTLVQAKRVEDAHVLRAGRVEAANLGVNVHVSTPWSSLTGQDGGATGEGRFGDVAPSSHRQSDRSGLDAHLDVYAEDARERHGAVAPCAGSFR